MRIVSKNVSTVKAGTPADEYELTYLSGADHFTRPRHSSVYLFFPAQAGGELVLPTKVLKQSLQQLLVHYPSVSGRLRRKPNSSCKYDLYCNDGGVEFVEATLDGNLSFFGDVQPNRLYIELLNPLPVGLTDVFEHPLMYTQVNRFACGGVILVASISHALADGISAGHLLVSWGELARGVELSNPPCNDRTLLKSTKGPDSEFNPRELRPIGDIASGLPKTDLSAWPTGRMFAFSPAQLKKLKSKATKEGAARAFSTHESICAHVWRSVTRARRLDPTTKTKFLTTLDARRRMKPNLSGGYFGNGICYVCAATTAGEILKQPLSHTAGLLRDAISAFNEDYMQSLLAYVENIDEPVAMNVNCGEDAGHDLCATNLTRLTFHEADFGSGKPLVTAPGNYPYHGNLRILPGQKDGYVHAYVFLEAEHILRLQEDPEFLLES